MWGICTYVLFYWGIRMCVRMHVYCSTGVYVCVYACVRTVLLGHMYVHIVLLGYMYVLYYWGIRTCVCTVLGPTLLLHTSSLVQAACCTRNSCFTIIQTAAPEVPEDVCSIAPHCNSGHHTHDSPGCSQRTPEYI